MSGEPYALLAVGGGPAALAAVRAYRDAGGYGAVALVAEEETVPYNRPPLTKELLRGDGDERDLPLESEQWLRDHGVSLIGARAVALDAEARTVALADGRELRWRQLLLATGAAPVRPPIPGADDPRVLVLRTRQHLRTLLERLRPGAAVAVVGSGFIGCEAAASLRRRGHPVTQISQEPAPQLARLGEEVATRLRGWLDQEGVEPIAGVEVERIDHDWRRARLHVAAAGEPGDDARLDAGAAAQRSASAAARGDAAGRGDAGSAARSEAGAAVRGNAGAVARRNEAEEAAGGRVVESEVVLMATGMRPRIELARAAGIPLEDGAVVADAAMRTAVAGVLAAGDVCRAEHAVAGRALRVEHWGDALAQGEVAGRTAAGAEARWETVPGFWSTVGSRTLKHAAWGDGWETVAVEEHDGGGFTARYRDAAGRLVGLLAHDADDDYDRGREEIAAEARR